MFMSENFFHYCWNGNIEGVEWCLLKDFDVNSTNKYGETGFSIACMGDNEKLVKLLLNDKRIKVNLQGKYGKTAFMWVCCPGDREKIVKLLLKDKRIKVNLQDKYGETAFMLACSYDNIEIVKLLLKDKRIKVNLQSKWGESGFMWACRKNNIEIVKLLLKDVRIDVNLKNIRETFNYGCNVNDIIKMIQRYEIKNSIKNSVEFNIN